jgi:hypothetical protein
VSDYLPGPQVGIPYKWGGFDDEAAFRAGLEGGKGAGSHQSNGVLDCVVGLDCSGFVSRVWGLPKKQGTQTLNATGVIIKAKDLKPGDALNKPGSHVVLFAGSRADGVPIFFEASGSASKVRLNSNASWAYLNGYSGLRYGGIADETPECFGTSDKPIRIDHFPFKDTRSTFLACSDRFGEYSCKRGVNESGKEFIYQVIVPTRSKLVARVSDGSETDIDLHLLSTLDAEACLARADSSLEHVVGPGTYYLVSDTWTDTSNLDRSGQYSLSIALEAAPDEPIVATEVVDAGAPQGMADIETSGSRPKSRSCLGCSMVPGVEWVLVLAVALGRRRAWRW